MTLRTAHVVIGIQAVVIAGLIAFILFSGPARIERAAPPGDRHAVSESVGSDEAGAPGRRRTSPPPETREAESRAAINPRPFVEPRDVVFSSDDPVGIVLFGKVTTAGGRSAPDDVSIGLEEDDTGEWRGSQVKGGAYALSGLRPGRWNLTARNMGFRELRQPLELVATAPRQRLDLVIEPSTTLKVKLVTPEGKLLHEALRAEKVDYAVNVQVVATTAAPSGDLPLTEMSGHQDYGVGAFRAGGVLGNVPKGYSALIELREGPPVYVSAVLRHVVLETKSVPAGADEVELIVAVSAVKAKLATLKLRLIDAETEAPVTKARVEASDRQSGGGTYPIDEKGNVVKEGLRPGLLYFSVFADGYESLAHYVRVEPGQVTDLGTIRLAKALTIEGVVVSEQGTGMEASLTYRNLDRMDFPQPLNVAMGYKAEADGTFKITGAGRGRGLIIASTKDREMISTLVDTSGGSLSNIRLVLKAGTRVVVEPKFSDTERYLVTLVDDAGTIWSSSYWSGRWVMRFRLPAGNYSFRIYDDKALRKTVPLTVGSTSLRFPLAP